MSDNKIKDIKSQGEKLERYINQFATRSVNVADALGSKGCKMLSDLLEKVEAL